MSQQPTLERDWPDPDTGARGLLFRSDYDENLVEALKAIEPRVHRRWVPDAEAWWVHPAHEADVVEASLQAFGYVKVVGSGGEPDTIIDRNGESVQERLL